MPNVTGGYGLLPVRHISGGETNNNAYPIASGYATAIYRGDLVMGAADGSIIKAPDATAAVLGVFWGCKYTAADGSIQYSKYWPAGTVGTAIEALVYDDPDIVYKVRTDATGAVAADVHALANLKTIAGVPSIGIAGSNLDIAGGTAATGKQLRILRIIDDGYNIPGPFSEVEVVLATSALKGVVAGVGGV